MTLEEAKAACDAAHTGASGPCYSVAYLEARRQYHALLVEAGQMDERMARNDARQMQAMGKLWAYAQLPAEERANLGRRWLPYTTSTPDIWAQRRRETMTSRVLTTHVVNPVNDRLVILVADEPGSGDANHRYEITGMDCVTNPSWDGANQNSAVILFQNGVIPEKGVNGVTNEALLAIVGDRLASFQAGPYAGAYNANALEHVYAALNALKERTMERMSRKVEGTEAL